MDRRRFLGAAAAVGLAGTAGCIASGDPRPPRVPEDRLAEDDWELVEREREEVFSEEFVGQELTATATTLTYANAALREEIAEKTVEQVTQPPATFFASRVTFDPDLTNLPGGVGRGEILDRVETESRRTLTDRMRDAGVEDVAREATGTFTVDSGEDARTTAYRGLLPIGPLEFTVADGERISIPAGDFAVDGHLAVWHHGKSVLVAGGVHPGENYAETTTADLSTSVTVTVDIDLDLDPEAYETDLFEVVSAVE